MNPYCPVCKKRVEARRILRSLAACDECGSVFDPSRSERLVPKCECGEDLTALDEGRFELTLPLVRIKCAKCRAAQDTTVPASAMLPLGKTGEK
jgi:hypothetical protein